MNSLKSHFLLDSDIIYLNHGSYGATPRSVFDEYQKRQLQLERDPVNFINNELPALLKDARFKLGHYLNADADDLVYVPNATVGINIVAHSLPLKTGDEVLTCNHEYGAAENAWAYVCRKRGAALKKQSVSFPVNSKEEILREILQGVTSHTKAIYLSHITSPTALRLPIAEICQYARSEGIMTIVDGAHAPGQLHLDLEALGADFYVGNCHKWLCSPKVAGFLHTRRSCQYLIEPLIVGWGWGENRKPSSESDYIDALQWQGTNDHSAYLSVPSAIKFQAQHNWPELREECHRLLTKSLERASKLTGFRCLYPNQGKYYKQMAVFEIPYINDLSAFNKRLYDEYRIQIPCIAWQGRHFIRISVQAYNSQEDLDALFTALEQELPAAQT